MFRPLAALKFTAKRDIRGGTGPARGGDYLVQGDMAGVLGCGRTILEAGSSVGEHSHPDTEELYLVLEGHGRALLDGASSAVGPGDLFVCKAGHAHGLINDSTAPLTYLAVLTRAD